MLFVGAVWSYFTRFNKVVDVLSSFLSFEGKITWQTDLGRFLQLAFDRSHNKHICGKNRLLSRRRDGDSLRYLFFSFIRAGGNSCVYVADRFIDQLGRGQLNFS